ncbi:hypothetical protein [Streptomyces sp. NPDC060194]|uniref:hypothetical protein n=1 Tax=Streptomyces sp. NPDC060194 TaxID=3347069 RepID=UPI00365B4BFD
MIEQGADERRVQHLLRARGVGPDAPDDWWDRLYDEEPDRRSSPRMPDWWSTKRPALGETPAPAPAPTVTVVELDEDEEPPAPSVWQAQPDYYPRPHAPAVIGRVQARVHAAPAAISPRTRAGLYNASAAGAGWALGLYDQFAYALADLGSESISGAILLGAVGSLAIAHFWDRRTRHWWPPLAWACRIPLATALTALALWAPAA